MKFLVVFIFACICIAQGARYRGEPFAPWSGHYSNYLRPSFSYGIPSGYNYRSWPSYPSVGLPRYSSPFFPYPTIANPTPVLVNNRGLTPTLAGDNSVAADQPLIVEPVPFAQPGQTFPVVQPGQGYPFIQPGQPLQLENPATPGQPLQLYPTGRGLQLVQYVQPGPGLPPVPIAQPVQLVNPTSTTTQPSPTAGSPSTPSTEPSTTAAANNDDSVTVDAAT